MQSPELGRYRIVKELGRGAMGRVFLARDPQIQRNVALKTVQTFAALPEADREGARERFLAEARAAGQLVHPGIVTLFDVGETEAGFYLAMEWVEGTTLDAFCRRDKLLPVATACEIVADVADALHYAHGMGVVHRDIKPANLMRVGDARAKIMDFGLARAAESQVTQDGAVLGTPSYMSPEQIRGQAIDGRSDLFSLAVVLFEMLTGDKPFPGDSVSSIIYRIVHEEPREPSHAGDRLPAELGRFLRKAMAKNPDERFPTGEAFAVALRAAVGTSRPVGPGPGASSVLGDASGGKRTAVPPPPARRKRSSARPFVLAVLLLVVLLAAAGYLFRDRLGWLPAVEPAEVWWETTVRTEPPGLAVHLDGVPLDPADQGRVRFKAAGPFGVLSAAAGCRTVERALDPADAGAEVVIVVDPTELEWSFDPGIPADVRLNGKELGQAPLDVGLDLCEENTLEFTARGYRDASLRIAAQATPLEARTALAGVRLEPLPMGRLVLPEGPVRLVYYVDGERLAASTRNLDLPEGEHEIRIKNEAYWIDMRRTITIRGGQTLEPDLSPPPLTTLVVQAFPANCKVYLRKPGGRWKYVDDTPARRRIAVGRYEVRVTLNPTGESRERTVELVAGDNPPVRVSFGRRS